MKSLGDGGRHTVEEMRPETVLQPDFRRSRSHYLRRKPFRIHFQCRRSVDYMSASLLQLATVAGFIARILAKIFVS